MNKPAEIIYKVKPFRMTVSMLIIIIGLILLGLFVAIATHDSTGFFLRAFERL